MLQLICCSRRPLLGNWSPAMDAPGVPPPSIPRLLIWLAYTRIHLSLSLALFVFGRGKRKMDVLVRLLPTFLCSTPLAYLGFSFLLDLCPARGSASLPPRNNHTPKRERVNQNQKKKSQMKSKKNHRVQVLCSLTSTPSLTATQIHQGLLTNKQRKVRKKQNSIRLT